MTTFRDTQDEKNATELMKELVYFKDNAQEVESASIMLTGMGKGTSSQKRRNLLRAIDYTKLALDRMRKLVVNTYFSDE